MKAAILTNPYLTEAQELYQPRRLAEALFSRGVAADILPNAFRVTSDTHTLTGYSFAVYLDKDKYAPRVLERAGLRLFNRAEAVELCDDKMLTHIALASVVPMPKTIPAPLCYKAAAEPLLPELTFPVVVKECFGSFGEQVYLVRTREELQTLEEKLKLRPHLFQEYIEESRGQDIRVICVGGEVVACMKRTNAHDFRSNLAHGGRGEPYPPDAEIRNLARQVTKTLRLDYCGIDLLLSKRGYLVAEVNSNAFFGGIERITGADVAGAYADHILREMGK